MKKTISIILAVAILSMTIVTAFGYPYGTDGTGALQGSTDNILYFPSDQGDPISAGGIVTYVVGGAILLGGSIYLNAANSKEESQLVYEKFNEQDQELLLDKVRTGAIKFKNGFMEYTGSAWNWIQDKIFGDGGVIEQSNPVTDPATGVTTATLSQGVNAEWDMWFYNSNDTVGQWINGCPNWAVMDGRTNHTIILDPTGGHIDFNADLVGDTYNFTMYITKGNGDIFTFKGARNGTGQITGLKLKQVQYRPNGNIYQYVTSTGISNNYNYTPMELNEWNGKPLFYDNTTKQVYTNSPSLEYITPPNWCTGIEDFAKKTVWANEYSFNKPITIQPNSWVNDNPVANDDSQKVVVPIPNITVNPNPNTNPDKVPDGNAQTAAENLSDLDPSTVTAPLTDTPVVPETPPIDPNTDKLRIDKNVILKKFPFSLPKDLTYMATLLQGTPKEITFTLPLSSIAQSYNNTFGGFGMAVNAQDYVVDLTEPPTDFTKVFEIIRWFIGITYVAGLIIVTRKVMM